MITTTIMTMITVTATADGAGTGARPEVAIWPLPFRGASPYVVKATRQNRWSSSDRL